MEARPGARRHSEPGAGWPETHTGGPSATVAAQGKQKGSRKGPAQEPIGSNTARPLGIQVYPTQPWKHTRVSCVGPRGATQGNLGAPHHLRGERKRPAPYRGNAPIFAFGQRRKHCGSCECAGEEKRHERHPAAGGRRSGGQEGSGRSGQSQAAGRGVSEVRARDGFRYRFMEPHGSGTLGGK